MGFGDLLGKAGASLGGGDLASKINGADVLKGFATNNGVNLSSGSIKSLISDPDVKAAIMNAIKTIVMKKLMSGKLDSASQSSVTQNLMQVADQIKKQAPDTKLSEGDIANKLQTEIESRMKV